jgi:hypothetical protein
VESNFVPPLHFHCLVYVRYFGLHILLLVKLTVCGCQYANIFEVTNRIVYIGHIIRLGIVAMLVRIWLILNATCTTVLNLARTRFVVVSIGHPCTDILWAKLIIIWHEWMGMCDSLYLAQPTPLESDDCEVNNGKN